MKNRKKPQTNLGQLVNDWLPPFYRYTFSRSNKKARRRLVFIWRPKPKTANRASKEFVFPFNSMRDLVITKSKDSSKLKTRRLILPLWKWQLDISRGQLEAKRYQTRELSLSRAMAIALLLIFLGTAGVWYFGAQLLQARSYHQGAEVSLSLPTPTTQPTQPKGFNYSEPIAVEIPRIGVSSSLIELGKKKDETIEVPKKYEQAGGYNGAPTPGEVGPAVIVGHVDSYQGPAVFYRLKELKSSDVIKIRRQDGKTLRFKVTAVNQFSQNNFPTQKVYGDIDYAGLRLITCGGVFNNTTLEYSHNTVVYASLIE